MGNPDCQICDWLRRLSHSPFGVLRRIYRFLFGRPSMQGLNDALLALALHGKGYNNCCDFRIAGEQHFLDYLAVRNPQVCLDIGANFGDYSRMLLEKNQCAAFRRLLDLEEEFPGRFSAVNKGVADRVCELPLYHDEEHSGLASFSLEVNEIDYVGARNKQSISVPVVTLDAFLSGDRDIGRGDIDFIKIDVEGFEYEVLAGASKTIGAQRPKFIQIEYNLHQLFRGRSLYDFSRLMPGYDIYQLLPATRGARAVDPRKPENNIFIYATFIFARKDVSGDFFTRCARGSA
jgi:FkbM family methyltransferase